MPQLPVEIILQIIDKMVDLGSSTPVAFPPKSLEAKTLCTLLTVSSAVHSTTKRLLYRHCLYIDSSERLRLLLRALEEPSWRKLAPVPILHCISNLYLSPFPLKLTNTDHLHLMQLVESIDDLPVAKWIHELFCLISPFLKRLIIDIPLRSLYPEDDHLSVRPVLREAFSRLTNLEEFTSTRDELYLSTKIDPQMGEPRIWTRWPQLRKLALYNVDVDASFSEAAKSLPLLDTLVLTRADGLANPVPQMFRKNDQVQQLRILIVNEERNLDVELGLEENYTGDDGAIRPVPDVKHFKGTVDVVKVGVTHDLVEAGFYFIDLIQRRVRDAAINGKLWQGHGVWTDCTIDYLVSGVSNDPARRARVYPEH